ncbi:probable ATP-dependent RNA helicase DDX31 [Nilaparvata lugens]|uniref:probable ATP-dependent RNA helicase DDX31 n=1 Tax=Nilaparvata lugens TaxID=108931 RepID=UPI00193E4EAA|nr:probable ATP-dependent RNA helicase DDX31 [Nilaparvata lugens]
MTQKDDDGGLMLNITTNPVPKHKKVQNKRKVEKHVEVTEDFQPKAKKKKLLSQDLKKESALSSGEGQSKGRISSLFANNPEIPTVSHKKVKPAVEDVFSKESFESLNIHKYIVQNLKQNFGITETTKVQQMSIPILLEGKDALIRSQTGSGKTLAYALPILHLLQQFEPKITRADGIKALVVIPTRELALQTYECFNKLVKSFAWLVPGLLVGGEKKKSEKARLRKGINILVGTPGRLLDHVENTKCVNLNTVQWFVLDEADRLLDMGYEKDVASLVNALEAQQSGFNRPTFRRQTILLSATMTPKVERLAGLTLNEPSRIDALSGGGGEGGDTSDQMTIPKSLKQSYIVTPPKLRLVTLAAIIHQKCQIEQGSRKMLVFMATQDMVDYHTELLTTVLTDSAEYFKLHGSMTQTERTTIFKTFRAAQSGVLFCTDVAARGLDLPNVEWIVQYTAPTTPSDYVHRVGRTARAGLAGSALIFLAPSELPFIALLEHKNIKLMEETMENCLNNLRLLPLEGADEFQRDRRGGGPTTEAAATALQLQFENSLYDQKKLHSLACKAYQSWVRFYASYPRESREAFDFKSLHLGHYAKSFALRDPPSTIKGMTNSKNEDQHNGYKERFNRAAKKPKQVRSKKFSEFDSGISFKKKKNKSDL